MSANTSAAPTELASKFDGGGVEYSAKYLGSCVVLDGQSQLLCQEAMQKLLTALKRRKEPKERLKVTLSLDGIRLVESAGDEKQPPQLDLLLRHCEVSYVYKEPRDQRSCALVRTEADPENAGKKINKFYGIRTLKSATPLLQDLRQLFQLVKERQEKGLAGTPNNASDNATADTGDGANKQEEAPAKESPQITDPATVVTLTPVAVTGGAAESQDSMTAATATEAAQGAALLAHAGMAAPVPAFAPAPVPEPVPVGVPAPVPETVTGRGANLMDMSQPDKPVRQSMASSSVGSLDELNELFSSQASLASSGGGGGGPSAVSFNPWAIQPPQHPIYQHQQVLALQQQQQALLHPPYMMLNRQLSHPHSMVACNREPARKSSHPNMLEPSQLAQAAAVYHENKRPSDPGLLQGSSPLEYLQQQYHHQQQQQALLQQMQYAQYQQMHQAQNPQAMFGPSPYGPAVYAAPGFAPMPPMPSYQMPPQPLWQQPGPQQQPQQPPPLLPPTSSTQLIEGDFVSVFDQQQREASEAAKKTS